MNQTGEITCAKYNETLMARAPWRLFGRELLSDSLGFAIMGRKAGGDQNGNETDLSAVCGAEGLQPEDMAPI